MDEITFVKKRDGDNELSCDDCVFVDACMRSCGEMAIMLDCTDGEIWLWTGYGEIPDQLSQHLDYAKIGSHKEDLPSYTNEEFGITLASSNQKIIKL